MDTIRGKRRLVHNRGHFFHNDNYKLSKRLLTIFHDDMSRLERKLVHELSLEGFHNFLNHSLVNDIKVRVSRELGTTLLGLAPLDALPSD